MGDTDGAAIQGAAGRLLIVNADDFGMTDGICRGVLRSHEHGIVTSTSALVVGPAFGRFAPALRDSGIAVGAHLAAVGEDPPVLAAAEIPTLVDRRGRFPLTWRRFVARAAVGAVDPDDLARELSAQLDLLVSADIAPSHVDTHQNLHLWPLVGAVVLDLARTRGIHAMRLPRSARWTPVATGVRILADRLAGAASRAAVAFPARSAGFDESGQLDAAHVQRVLARLASTGAPSVELVTHLAEDPDPGRERYRSDYRWSDDLDAMLDPAVRASVERLGFVLGSYHDLPSAAPRPAPNPPTRTRARTTEPIRTTAASPAAQGRTS